MRALFLIAPAASLLALAGCNSNGVPMTDMTLFSGAGGWSESYHTRVVADPFGGPDKVVAGGPTGPAEPYQNKGSFISEKGFFKRPAGPAELVIRLAVTRLTDIKVEVWARQPKCHQKFTARLAAEGSWQELVLPLDAEAIAAGATVNDITIFQVGHDKTATLYIDRVTLRAR